MTTSQTTPDRADRKAVMSAAVERLTNAIRTAVPCAPVRDLLGESDIDLAYAVQQQLTERRVANGGRIVGRKIGLTSPAVQQQLGVDRPDFGVLFDDMDVTGRDEVSSALLIQPKVEAEIAFVVGTDLTAADLDLENVRAAVDYAVAALEIVDSRIDGWDIKITDTVADNASSGLYVLGSNPLTLNDFDPIEVTMRMYVGEELVSVGNGAACLGDPLTALLWLARTSREFGEPLRAGQVVLSGALGPMASAPRDGTVRAEISPLGTVTVAFTQKDKR